jgi:hypothetical protein
MLNGIPNKAFVIITMILMLSSIPVKAQFPYNFEIFAEKTFSSLYSNNTSISGDGIELGIKYNFCNTPLWLSLGYTNSKFSDHSLSVYSNTYESKISSIDFDIRYLFFRQSVFKPYIFAGVNHNTIDYMGRIPVLAASSDENNYSDQSKFNAFGLKIGTGLNVRLSDRFGLTGNIMLHNILQNKNNWVENNMFICTYAFGVYYRFNKNKNNLSL